jgi:hypothetical protein
MERSVVGQERVCSEMRVKTVGIETTPERKEDLITDQKEATYGVQHGRDSHSNASQSKDHPNGQIWAKQWA